MALHRQYIVAALLGVLVGLLFIALGGCGGGSIWDALGTHKPITPGGPSGPVGPREEFAHLLAQLQWIFIGLGIAGVVASIWVPLISTRHAVGAVAVGIGIALIKPFVIALYWPTIICLGLAAVAAVWPYALAVYTWARVRITGKPAPISTTGIVASLKSLVMPRAAAVGARFPDVPVGPAAVGDRPTDPPVTGI